MIINSSVNPMPKRQPGAARVQTGRVRPLAARVVPLVGVTCAAAGCAVSAAPTVGSQFAESNRPFLLGGRISGFLNTARDSGVAIGATHEEAWTLNASPSLSPDRFQAALSVGYASVPLPYRGRVGWEAHALGGVGRLELERRLTPGLTTGARFGLPIRLARSSELWNSEVPISGLPMIVPELAGTIWFPYRSGDWRDPKLELNAGLALRFYFWSSLMP